VTSCQRKRRRVDKHQLSLSIAPVVSPLTPPIRRSAGSSRNLSSSPTQSPQEALATLLKLEEDLATTKHDVDAISKKTEDAKVTRSLELSRLGSNDAKLTDQYNFDVHALNQQQAREMEEMRRQLLAKHEEQHAELEYKFEQDIKNALREQTHKKVELARIEQELDKECEAKLRASTMLEQDIRKQQQRVPMETLWPYLRETIEAKVAAERMEMDID